MSIPFQLHPPAKRRKQKVAASKRRFFRLKTGVKMPLRKGRWAVEIALAEKAGAAVEATAKPG